MPIVTVCNHKGGTGKTTTVIHLAAAVGLSGRRTLAIDLDPQGFLTRMLGVDDPPPAESSLALLDPQGDLRTLPMYEMSGFDLLPASGAMNRALRKLTKPTDVLWLRETLNEGHDYDFIVFDTAAAVSVYTMNALVASDHVLIPVTPEYQPVVGAEQTWQTAKLVREKLNPGLEVPRLLLTQVDARKRDHASYAQYLRDNYGDRVLQRIVRTSASLAEATRDGKTVFDLDVASRGALDYANAADVLTRDYFPPEADVVESEPAGSGSGEAPPTREEESTTEETASAGQAGAAHSMRAVEVARTPEAAPPGPPPSGRETEPNRLQPVDPEPAPDASHKAPRPWTPLHRIK